MNISQSGAQVKKVETIKTKDKLPAPKAKEINKVEFRDGFIILFRVRDTDEWKMKGAGMEVARNKELAIGTIPPEATEAFVLHLELPFENK